MASLFEGALASAIYAGFKGKLLKGVLRRETASGSAGLDSLGDPLATVVETWACQGFTDLYSAFYRSQAGIPDTDLKANIFAKSLAGGVVPTKDDQVKFTVSGVATWYQVRKVDVDPATALWVCQAFEIADPTA